MNVLFDIFGQTEIPAITLCNPNKTELYSLGLAYDTKITPRFNAVSEFEFKFPESIDGGETPIEAYYYLKNKRLIKIDGFGYFQIVNVTEKSDGAVSFKEIKCMSLEVELMSRRVSVYSGTKKLYDPISPTGTVLEDMVALAPNWTVEYVDGSLLAKHRTFNVSDTNIYNFLMNDVATAFECVFSFNTETRTITVKSLENAVSPTDIYMSFDNLIQDSEFSEISDEITTCLSVYGGGTLSIRGVNPLGTNKIYNFDYFKNTQWMSQSLIDQINTWENTIEIYRQDYLDTLIYYKNANAELIVLEGELADLQAEYSALEQVQAVRIQGGLPYGDIIIQMQQKQAEIDQKQVEITNKQTQIDGYVYMLNGINSLCSFVQNFTEEGLAELENFIFENTYKNDNIIQTDNMTPVEVQEAEQSLYDQAQTVLIKVSAPRYEVKINSANYINQQAFSIFTSQTAPGCSVVAEIKDINAIESLVMSAQDGISPPVWLNMGLVTVVLLELSFSFDNPEDFSMIFSNRLRLDDGNFIYSDLVGQTVKTGATVSFDAAGWSNWQDNYKDTVSTFITSALDATVNNIISNSNQEVKIDQTGLRARKYNPSTSSYEDEQIWMTNNVLAFSNDGFNTASLALGKILTPSGSYSYGIITDKVERRMLKNVD